MGRTRLLRSGNGHLSGPGTKILWPSAPGPTPPLRPDYSGNVLQGFECEEGTHLSVARLVPPHAGKRPEVCEQTRTVGVDGQGDLARKRTRPAVHAVAVPLDPAISARDEWEPFGVDLDPKPMRFRDCPELVDGPLLER